MFLLAVLFAVVAEQPSGNPVACSANGRFCAVLRWDEKLADFEVRWDDPKPRDWSKPEPKTITVALYEGRGRRRISEFAIPRDVQKLLVSDYGRHVAVVGALGRNGCDVFSPSEGDLLVAVYRADGTRVGSLNAGDVFTAHDLRDLFDLTFALRHESDAREIFVVGVRDESAERRIDLATVKLLDAKAGVFERRFGSVTAMTAEAAAREFQQLPACAAMFDDPSVAQLDSAAFLERAQQTPLPDYPVMAYKSRIGGTVRAGVLVSERGEVLCVRTSPLPFGLSDSAREAASKWSFRPSARPYAGEILFHFTQ